MKKRLLSLVLALVMMLSLLPATASAAGGFAVYYTYTDLQINKTSSNQRYGSNCNDIAWQLLPGINGGRGVYLAKNELEAFQVVFYEQGDGRTLDIQFTPFVNDDGEVLECKVYNELFLSSDATGYKLADALVPYNHEGVQTTKNENNVFFLELHSKKDQTPGNYVSTVTLSDESGVISTCKMTAVVWNFALPEAHLSTYLVGTYNTSSGYYTTSGFLRLGGVRFANWGIVEEDKEKAEQILEAYDEMFLENGVTPYEIPAYLIEKDEKEAQLAMADTRRSMFMVPVADYGASSEGQFTNQGTVNTVNKYNELVGNNKQLRDKAFFYPVDEPSWANEAQAATYIKRINAIKNTWGEDYHAMVPFYAMSTSSYGYDLLKSTSDILCANQSCVVNTDVSNDNDSKRELRAEMGSGNWHKTLRYQSDTQYGNTYLFSYNRSTKGVYARLLQWQAAALHSDGMLHWNGIYVPDNADGTPYDVFKTNALCKGGPSTGNGDGIYAYSGVSLGFDATTPIPSLRLKQIQSGMDDYDYLYLVREFIGEEAFESYLCRFFRNYAEAGTDQIWFPERYNGGWDGDYVAWCIDDLVNARIAMGNALSEVAGSTGLAHDYGQWQTAVEADETHCGLEIRECAVCGAKESRQAVYSEPVHEHADADGDFYCDGCDYEFLAEAKTAAINELSVYRTEDMADTHLNFYNIAGWAIEYIEEAESVAAVMQHKKEALDKIAAIEAHEADVAAYQEYKTKLKADCEALILEDDSENTISYIRSTETLIEIRPYMEDMTLAENKAELDKIVTELVDSLVLARVVQAALDEMLALAGEEPDDEIEAIIEQALYEISYAQTAEEINRIKDEAISDIEAFFVARIVGGKGYDTLTAALKAAKPGDTVKLLKSITSEDFVVVKADVTLDLNGKSISGAMMVYVTGNMIDSASVENRGLISADGYMFDPDTQKYIPIYDSAAKGYKLFNLQFSAGNTGIKEGKMTFTLSRSDGERSAVYALLRADSNYDARFKVVVTLKWAQTNMSINKDFIYDKSYVDELLQYDAGGQNAAFTAVISGLNGAATAQPRYVICDGADNEIFSFDGPEFSTTDGKVWK